MFSLFGNSKEEVAAVFDIGNGSVGGALVKLSSAHPPIILYSHREPIGILSHVTGKRLESRMLKLLRDVAEHIAKDGLSHIRMNYFGPTIRGVHCVYASPWYVAETKTVSSELDRPKAVTQAYIDSLLQKEQEAFEQSLRSAEGGAMAEAKLIERKVIDVRLNGYSVADPVGQEAKTVELSFFTSFVSEPVLKEIELLLRRVFNYRKIRHHTFALAGWEAVLRTFPEPSDFLLLDVTGEVTDLTLSRNGVLTETASFPTGRNTVIRHVAKELGVEQDIAASYVSMHLKNAAERKFAEKLSSLLAAAREDWKARLVDCLRDLSKRHTLPKTAYVTADADLAKLFSDALGTDMPIELAIPGNAFATSVLGAEALGSHYHVVDGVPNDSFLGLESLYLAL